MNLHGHAFVPFKSVEMICWACGFVLSRTADKSDAERELLSLDGGACPKVWHGTPAAVAPHPVNDSEEEK